MLQHDAMMQVMRTLVHDGSASFELDGERRALIFIFRFLLLKHTWIEKEVFRLKSEIAVARFRVTYLLILEDTHDPWIVKNS